MIIYVIFSSLNGHVYKLAQAVAEGARSVAGASVKIFKTADLVPDEIPEKYQAMESRKSFDSIPIIGAWELAGADAIIFGTATKSGMISEQMRSLLDRTGPLWADGVLIGKVGSVFTSTTTRRGGRESALSSFYVTLLHLGMIIVGVPYGEKRLLSVEAISGRSSYAPSPIVESDETRRPNENEIAIARFQGQHVAEITQFLLLGKEHSSGRR